MELQRREQFKKLQTILSVSSGANAKIKDDTTNFQDALKQLAQKAVNETKAELEMQKKEKAALEQKLREVVQRILADFVHTSNTTSRKLVENFKLNCHLTAF